MCVVNDPINDTVKTVYVYDLYVYYVFLNKIILIKNDF